MNDSWYETIEATVPLTQGDLITDCPLVGWASQQLDLDGGLEDEVLKAAAEAVRADVVVMTQACDLEHGKVENVILCPHVRLHDYRVAWGESMTQRKQNPSEKAWQRHCSDIQDGFHWNLTILNEGGDDTLNTEHRIVDFHEVFTVPRTFLEALLLKRGSQRLRLLPPYREHLSQAFARFFMRVGLPVPVSKVWSSPSGHA